MCPCRMSVCVCLCIRKSAWVMRLYSCVCLNVMLSYAIFQTLSAAFFFCTARRFLRFRFNSILLQNRIIHSVKAHYSQIELVNICARCGAYLFKMIYGYDFQPLFFDWIHIQVALFSELPGCYTHTHTGILLHFDYSPRQALILKKKTYSKHSTDQSRYCTHWINVQYLDSRMTVFPRNALVCWNWEIAEMLQYFLLCTSSYFLVSCTKSKKKINGSIHRSSNVCMCLHSSSHLATDT